MAGTFAPSSHATTTATELGTANNNSNSTISVGIVPPPVSTPVTGPAWLANLWARFNQYNILTRMWLFSRFFG